MPFKRSEDRLSKRHFDDSQRRGYAVADRWLIRPSYQHPNSKPSEADLQSLKLESLRMMNFLKGDSKDESCRKEKSSSVRPNDKDLESGTSTLIEQPSTIVQESTEAEQQEVSKESELPADMQTAAAIERNDKTEKVVFDQGPIPDGEYGWIIQHDTYPGASVQYAWVAGVAVSSAFSISPFTSYLCKRLPLRVTPSFSKLYRDPYSSLTNAFLYRTLWRLSHSSLNGSKPAVHWPWVSALLV
ncbi:2089_t:CDS:2 [Acaulospora colombiana]|uniref:2089_t:CDS:1 n=1 Tax=Acaulospora colombiana TaxID=27376 RepID=A0ACA9N4K4_9GLOM|nr:2089_t:CDS:2 [Acaulospora colombiana]